MEIKFTASYIPPESYYYKDFNGFNPINISQPDPELFLYEY